MARLPLLPLDANGRPTSDPLAHYVLTNFDLENEPQYTSAITIDGEYYIKKINNTAGTVRFYRGDGSSDHDSDFTDRINLPYDRIDTVF